MFKKLDKLIIQAFIGPFAATFFITLMVLVMQFFWLWIDDFVGKGLSTGVILEFIWYQSSVLVPLALPLAVLLSSLMTFGNLGESYELVAVKSAGISLLRFMQPLFFVVLFICGIAFLFSNYIIPVANLKARTLLGDIVYAKPSFDLREGVFYNKIGGFAIKVGKKEANDSIIRDIIIYEQSTGLQDNFIIANSGIMRVSDNKRFLEFNLQNGWRYQERSSAGSTNTEFIRLGFKEYNKQFDLSTFQFQRSADSINQGNWKMKNMKQLRRAIDSIEKQNQQIGTRVKKEVFFPASFTTFIDSNWKQKKIATATIKNFNQIIPDSLEKTVLERINSKLTGLYMNNESLLAQFEQQKKDLRRHQIEWHRKISLSFACLVLFIIGAPLGSIIRKGGLGNSMISAIVFFMVFYFISNSGEKFAKEGELNTFFGMWLSTFILLPIGIFLTYKAIHDSQLFNKEYYYRVWRKLRVKWDKRRA
ncbi:MAG TPA: LptF/LptG family permease [Chitinophagaceae bacterium]|nr:LptF/LptG family permease [Chitinophagaceae bacterium]